MTLGRQKAAGKVATILGSEAFHRQHLAIMGCQKPLVKNMPVISLPIERFGFAQQVAIHRDFYLALPAANIIVAIIKNHIVKTDGWPVIQFRQRLLRFNQEINLGPGFRLAGYFAALNAIGGARLLRHALPRKSWHGEQNKETNNAHDCGILNKRGRPYIFSTRSWRKLSE